MTRPNCQFVMSTELECLTSLSDGINSRGNGIRRFFSTLSTLAPTLPAAAGVFNGYGRIYVDCGHVELALAELDSPYSLALVVERQQRLVAKALKILRSEGCHLLLANNNHSGLLQVGCPVWGAHENYMTERRPAEFGDQLILPFLVTRIYGGAGGIEHPSGQFVAAVRPICMEHASGGETTHSRAIHSTCRDEHHMGRSQTRFRYHLILGDGHRSQFNLALQFGATALVLKAILFDKQLPFELRALQLRKPGETWVGLLRRLNVLSQPGSPLVVPPEVIQTQRVYLEAVRRYANSLDNPPGWIERLLGDWEDTLSALERTDRAWLAPRLDTFAKYEFYSSVLSEKGAGWNDLPKHSELFHELALLDHSYHEFANPGSVFNCMQEAGLLQHRVGEIIEPGGEDESNVPETTTRAKARAQFICRHSGARGLVMDWDAVYDIPNNRLRTLHDPFARRFSSWTESPDRRHQWRRIAEGMLPF